MKDFFIKIGIALGLYKIETLLAKFNEIFITNQKRYFKNSQKIGLFQAPYAIDEGQTVFINNNALHKRNKTIYFLVHCFYPFSSGGTERFVYNMAAEAQKSGNKVKIITYNATRSRRYFKKRMANILYNEFSFDGLDIIEYRHMRAPRGILKDIVMDDPDVFQFAEFLFARSRPDVVHVAYIQKVSSFIEACRKNNIPYGITLTSFYSHCHYDVMIDKKGNLCSGSENGYRCGKLCKCLDVKDPIYRYHKMHRILQDAVFVSAPSIFVRKVAEKEFPDIHVQVINHGVSREFLLDDKKSPDSGIRNFAYFGNLNPIKGVHGLITAFKDLPSGYNLNIFGSGSELYQKRLKKLAKGFPNIKFHGNIKYDEMNKAYANNDAIVVPSIWYETYNFVVHESLLMNRFVIAARIGAMPERIREGKNGLCFEAGNWQDLKAALEKATRIKDCFNFNADSYINTVSNEFTRYLELYQAALDGSNL